MTKRMGVVLRFGNKGFGWIRPDSSDSNAGPEVFVHVSDIVGRKVLQAGDRVEFEIQQTDRGTRAILVRLAQDSELMTTK